MEIATGLPGVILRPWRIEDKENLVRHGNDIKIWRNCEDSFPHPFTPIFAEHWLAVTQHVQPPMNLAIALDGVAVGDVGLIPQTGPNSLFTAKLVLWIGGMFWGQGIGTAAVKAITDYALNKLAFVRVESMVFEWNPASMRVMQKAGYLLESIAKRSVYKEGRIIDAAVYAMTRKPD